LENEKNVTDQSPISSSTATVEKEEWFNSENPEMDAITESFLMEEF
jgi:hypothetical protein